MLSTELRGYNTSQDRDPPVVKSPAEESMFGLGVLTVSTSGSQGTRDDSSGQAIKEIIEGDDFEVGFGLLHDV